MPIIKYHIGTSQWYLEDWIGSFFTKDAGPADFLRQYATVFNSVEGGETFHKMPDKKTILEWAEQVPAEFKFCFRFPHEITHQKKLQDTEEEVLGFLELFSEIRNRLGPFHIQLGSGFSYLEMEKIEKLAEILPAHFRYALEVRHPDFFDKGRNEKHLTGLLASYGIDRVIFDTRKLHSIARPDSAVELAKRENPRLPVRFNATGSHPFVRYMGANDVLNNESYLKEWAIITANWIREGKHPYIFLHTPDKQSAPALARFFHRELSRLIDLQEMPGWPVERKDQQLGLF